MTVSSTTAKVSYSGNGATTAFAVPFYFLANSDLLVVLRSATGVETTQVLTTNYTVTGAGVSAGGTITMNVAPASGATLTIVRNSTFTQTTDLLPNDRLPAESIETAFDKATMLSQQLNEVSSRALKIAVSDSSSISTTLPTSSARASKYLAFDTNGEPTVLAGPTSAYVDPTTYGAVGDGVADDTLALRNTFAFAIPNNRAVMLKGTYLISGYIGLLTSTSSGGLHIACNGPVTINVSGSSTAFRQVIFAGATGTLNASISGGLLTINCNNKAAVGIDLYSASGSLSGSVSFTSAITINDCKANDASATYENGGIAIDGRFANIYMDSPRVVGVERTNTSGGACYGISIISLAGECVIVNPYIQNILCPNGTNGVDADGIKIFGINNATDPALQTLGKATVQGGSFIDCQGRSIKSQCSNVTVLNPYFKRQAYVSIINSHDVDFQSGNGVLIEPVFEYLRNSGTSPLGTSHIPVGFQQRISDVPQLGKCVGGVLKTEVSMRNFALLTQVSTSSYSETQVIGLRIEPMSPLTTTAFTRSILETDALTVLGKSVGTKIVLSDINGPMNCGAFGYTGYAGVGSFATKLDYEVTSVNSTLAADANSLITTNLSGSQIGEVKAFLVRDNANFRDFFANAVFNFNNLIPGCKFRVVTNSGTYTNAPSWAAGRNAFIEVLGGPGDSPVTSTNRNIRVTVDNAGVVENEFYTSDGGTTWQELLFGTTSGTTKTVTGLLNVSGTVQVGGTINALTKVLIGGTFPTSVQTTYALNVAGDIPSGTTATYIGSRSAPSTADAAFTVGNLIHYYAAEGTLTGGSRLAPTSQFGYAVDANLISATNNYAFYAQVPNAANRYNFYSAGTAPSFFVGAIGVDRSTLTIAAGAVTATRNYHALAGEGGLADDLTDITQSIAGHILVLRAASDSVTITVKSTGNIATAGSDMVLDNEKDTITLIYDGALSKWLELARSNNGP